MLYVPQEGFRTTLSANTSVKRGALALTGVLKVQTQLGTFPAGQQPQVRRSERTITADRVWP